MSLPGTAIYNRPSRSLGLLWMLLLCCNISGCARPQPTEFAGWFKEFSTCRDEYAAMDERVAAAGVGDAAYYRVPGFPYLRTDRVLASYGTEVKTIDQVYANDQVRQQGLVWSAEHSSLGPIELSGSPLRYGRSQVGVRYAPPTLGEHSAQVRDELLHDE